MQVGVFGAGRIGQGLTTLLQRAGWNVVLGSRSPGRQRHFTDVPLQDVPLDQAVAASIVVIALPHDAIESNLDLLLRIPAHALVIDCANAVRVVDGRMRSPLDVPHGRWLARLLPKTRVARAFSHIQDELLVSRATRQPDTWAVGIAADDPEAMAQTAALVEATRYVPVEVGSLDQSQPLDAGGALFPNMCLPGDMRAILEGETR